MDKHLSNLKFLKQNEKISVIKAILSYETDFTEKGNV